MDSNNQSSSVYTATLFILVLCFIRALPVHAQVVNSFATDNTGLFYNSLDSMLQIVKKHKSINSAIVRGVELESFPEAISGVGIVYAQQCTKLKKLRMKPGELLLSFQPLVVDRGRISVNIVASEWNGKGFSRFERGAYTFIYIFDYSKEHYVLTNVKGGP